jgi:hypothetical protein
MECALMPTMLEREVQLLCSIRARDKNCRRAICRRYGYCVPPRDYEHQSFYRCPFDDEDAWLNRVDVVGKVAERLMKVAEASNAARGLPSPLAPKPIPDHLDLTKPLDVAALLASRPDDNESS